MTPTVPALLLHGAGGGAWEWDLWVPVLRAAGITPHAIDLPHAVAPHPTGWDDAVACVHAALDGLPRPGGPRVIVGASLGGLLAAACAQRVDAIVLLNPMPPVPWSSALAPSASGADGMHPWQTHARLASTRRAVPDADPATALAAFRRWRDCPGRLLHDARTIAIPRVDRPGLMLVSDHDNTVPPTAMRAWAGDWGMQVESASDASHAGVLLGRDAPALAARVVHWIQTLPHVERPVTP